VRGWGVYRTLTYGLPADRNHAHLMLGPDKADQVKAARALRQFQVDLVSTLREESPQVAMYISSSASTLPAGRVTPSMGRT